LWSALGLQVNQVHHVQTVKMWLGQKVHQALMVAGAKRAKMAEMVCLELGVLRALQGLREQGENQETMDRMVSLARMVPQVRLALQVNMGKTEPMVFQESMEVMASLVKMDWQAKLALLEKLAKTPQTSRS
jgi:hypothetical protein